MTCVLILYIHIPNMNWIDAVFQKLLSGHQILITDGRTHARTHARTHGQELQLMPLHHSSNGGGIKIYRNGWSLKICGTMHWHITKIKYGVNEQLNNIKETQTFSIWLCQRMQHLTFNFFFGNDKNVVCCYTLRSHYKAVRST